MTYWTPISSANNSKCLSKEELNIFGVKRLTLLNNRRQNATGNSSRGNGHFRSDGHPTFPVPVLSASYIRSGPCLHSLSFWWTCFHNAGLLQVPTEQNDKSISVSFFLNNCLLQVGFCSAQGLCFSFSNLFFKPVKLLSEFHEHSLGWSGTGWKDTETRK